jgi:hypothetical protein
VLALYVSPRKGKEDNIYASMKKKMTFVGLEPTFSVIRADVLSQLD